MQAEPVTAAYKLSITPAEPPARRLPPLHGTLGRPRSGADSGGGSCPHLPAPDRVPSLPGFTVTWALVNKMVPAPLPIHLLGFSVWRKGSSIEKLPETLVTPVHKHHPEQRACTWANTLARHCPPPEFCPGEETSAQEDTAAFACGQGGQRSRLLQVGSCE